jgi:glycosyltransferase involved in cell wall biosynthesis
MRICIVGKYPPIEGGVSMRTFWAAHGLAKLGHSVHVVTNAKEVGAPYRMFMRQEDWAFCNARYATGSVTVHWTHPYPRRQWHIPAGMPYITKLASLGLELADDGAIDIVHSYYAEPYCIAGHLIAQAKELPHVVRTAGTDVGRLWSLPQFVALYNHVFRSAAAVICGPIAAQKMIEAGVEPSRLALDPELVPLHDLFMPEGDELDVALLRQQASTSTNPHFRDSSFGEFDPSLSYFGLYGKLLKEKGAYALLEAFKTLLSTGVRAGLLVMAHEPLAERNAFAAYLKANALEPYVCQLPYLPHWRVPEFIRRCAAVCCLEQNFPIKFHTPVIAREVITCGGCLIASIELMQKLPGGAELIDRGGCIAVSDVSRADDLAAKLAWVLNHPADVSRLRHEARRHGVAIDAGNAFPRRLESILAEISTAGKLSPGNIRRPLAGPDLPVVGANAAGSAVSAQIC